MIPDTYKQAEAHLAAADPVLRQLIAMHGPCLLSPGSNRFAGLARAVIGQQLGVAAAAAIWRRFRELFPHGNVLPEHIVAWGPDALRAAGLSAAKARCISELACAVREGRLDLEQLDRLVDEDVIVMLTGIKGIGRWTAEMFLIFSLGRLDVLAVGDVGLRRAIQRAYGLAASPSPEEMRAIAAPWHPYASVACWYLWRSLDALPASPTQPSCRSVLTAALQVLEGNHPAPRLLSILSVSCKEEAMPSHCVVLSGLAGETRARARPAFRSPLRTLR